MIDTIAMIGSPASRGAVASVVGAGRDCLAAASAVGAASAAIAASVTTTGPPNVPSPRWIAPSCRAYQKFDDLAVFASFAIL